MGEPKVTDILISVPLFSFAGFPAAYAAYAAGRGYSGYPSFGLPYPTGNLNLATTLHDHFNSLHNHNHHHHHPNHHHSASATSNHHNHNHNNNNINNSGNANPNHCNNSTGNNPLLHQLITSPSCQHPLLHHHHHHAVPLDGGLGLFPQQHHQLNRHNHSMHLWTESALLAAAIIASRSSARARARQNRERFNCCTCYGCLCFYGW